MDGAEGLRGGGKAHLCLQEVVGHECVSVGAKTQTNI
jgi:hypothetical protein